MAIKLTCFSDRSTGRPYNKDAVLLDGQVPQGHVSDYGEVNKWQLYHFTVAIIAKKSPVSVIRAHCVVLQQETPLATDWA